MFLMSSPMKRIQVILEGYFFQNLVHHCDFQILHCDSIRQLLFSSFFEYRYTRRNKYTFGYMTRQTKVDDDSHAKVFHFWLLSNRKCNWFVEGGGFSRQELVSRVKIDEILRWTHVSNKALVMNHFKEQRKTQLHLS